MEPCRRPATSSTLLAQTRPGRSRRSRCRLVQPRFRRPRRAIHTQEAEDLTVSRSVNKIILVGNVGSDPDVRITSAGVKVARISLATNWRTGGEDPEERTDWHRVNLWGRLAQVAEDYVSKGDKLFVEGYLQYDSYERDGVTIPTAEVRAREMIMLTPPPAGEM
ncbi:MAG: single-stranded DNA-binding protein [Gemmatimonadetes bacterium]|nr:single-stranded DNA-binding protein [Gemmatimonadota bacterium]